MNTEQLPLHRKYRPQTFDEIYGNKDIIEAIKIKVEEKKTTTYLLVGQRGTGKSTISRIIANELGASEEDIKILDTSDIGLKDSAREIKKHAKYPSLYGKAKVYILEEIQAASIGFMHAMLTILEEPPKNVYFIICTTNPEKLLKPVKSRCTTFEMKPLTRNEMIELLTFVCKEEGVDDFPISLIKEVAKKVDGIPREGLILLDKIIDLEDEEAKNIINDHSLEDNNEVIELCRLLMNPSATWKEYKTILKNLKEDPESIRIAVLGYLASVLLNSEDYRASEVGELFEESFINSRKFGLVNAVYLASKITPF